MESDSQGCGLFLASIDASSVELKIVVSVVQESLFMFTFSLFLFIYSGCGVRRSWIISRVPPLFEHIRPLLHDATIPI